MDNPGNTAEDGFLPITDRIKNLLQVSGHPVAPAQSEALLLTHDWINDVAVIQNCTTKGGVFSRTYVVLKNLEKQTKETKTHSYDWFKERMVSYDQAPEWRHFLYRYNPQVAVARCQAQHIPSKSQLEASGKGQGVAEAILLYPSTP